MLHLCLMKCRAELYKGEVWSKAVSDASAPSACSETRERLEATDFLWDGAWWGKRDKALQKSLRKSRIIGLKAGVREAESSLRGGQLLCVNSGTRPAALQVQPWPSHLHFCTKKTAAEAMCFPQKTHAVSDYCRASAIAGTSFWAHLAALTASLTALLPVCFLLQQPTPQALHLHCQTHSAHGLKTVPRSDVPVGSESYNIWDIYSVIRGL